MNNFIIIEILFYRILEFIFGIINGLLLGLQTFISKVEYFFHEKIEFYKVERWIKEDIEYENSFINKKKS